jgi:hypothetical protein
LLYYWRAVMTGPFGPPGSPFPAPDAVLSRARDLMLVVIAAPTPDEAWVRALSLSLADVDLDTLARRGWDYGGVVALGELCALLAVLAARREVVILSGQDVAGAWPSLPDGDDPGGTP